jgi:glycosyltransferase involved in cell wall biosynthesis
MRVAIVNTQVLFVRGGAEYLAETLAHQIREMGHEAEIINIPFRWYPAEMIPRHMLAARLLKIDAGITPDLMIGLKFPSYLVPFPNKKLWLLHQHRQAYELWDTPYADIPDTPEGRAIRQMIIKADNLYLSEATEIYTNSKIVAGRLERFNGISAKAVLYPPLLQPEIYHAGEFGNYFFYPSRMTSGKRQELAIQAMRYVKSNFKLVLAGKPDGETYGKHLNSLIERYRLQDRVVMLGYISDEEKARWMAGACAALYIPFDEDSYGYVTLEAFHSYKPVITLTDSGGTDEVIEHEWNGLILQPEAKALAEGMEKLWSDRKRTQEMGEAAYQTLSKHHIRWENVLDNLLS